MAKNNRPAHRHGGFLSIDQAAYRSRLRSWNPALKAALSLGVLAVCLAADRPLVSLAAILCCGCLTVLRGGLSLRGYRAFLRIPLAFLLVGAAAVAVQLTRSPLPGGFSLSLGWFYLCVTPASLRAALFLSLRALGAVSALFLLALSTPAHEIFTLLRRARCPRLMVELMHLIYRYIFILLEIQSRMRAAAESRLGFRNFKTSCDSFGRMAASLLVQSVRRAGTCYDAMESRCYNGDLRFLEEPRPVSREQIVWTAACLGLLLAVWLLVWERSAL